MAKKNTKPVETAHSADTVLNYVAGEDIELAELMPPLKWYERYLDLNLVLSIALGLFLAGSCLFATQEAYYAIRTAYSEAKWEHWQQDQLDQYNANPNHTKPPIKGYPDGPDPS